MVQLLRLRQCTSHPFMLERTIKESWTSEDLEELKKQLHKFSMSAKPFYEQCKIWVKKSEERNAPDTLGLYAGTIGGENEEVMPFGKSKYGHKFNFDKAVCSLDEKALFARVTCGICSDVPRQPSQLEVRSFSLHNHTQLQY